MEACKKFYTDSSGSPEIKVSTTPSTFYPPLSSFVDKDDGFHSLIYTAAVIIRRKTARREMKN